MKNYFIDFYIKLFEKLYSNKDNKRVKNMWTKLKNNPNILKKASEYYNNNFYSNIICAFIINDTSMYNTEIYNIIANKILKHTTLARTKTPRTSSSFLMTILNNKDLILTKEQKAFLIFEAEASPYTKNFYETEKNTPIIYHGSGLLDIRFNLLKNKNFSLQEKKNLFLLLYPDDILKIKIIEELEYFIQDKLQLDEKTLYNFYILSEEELIKTLSKYDNNIIDIIKLCKYERENIPEETMKLYKNNDY